MSGPFVPEEFEVLLWWIRERENIRKLKEAGAPKPWSEFNQFQSYRWCNVSRMDDRVSRELMQQWYVDADPQTQLVAATLGRLINWPAALLDATQGRPFALADLANMRPALQARAARGEKVFTGAYVVPGVPGRNKVDSIVEVAERVSAAASSILQPTLRGTWQGLVDQEGIGSFLGGQIAADLAQLSTGKAWADGLTWAPVGPGSERGMNRLRGRPKSQKVSQAQFDRELPEYMEIVRPHIADIAADRRLCAQDFQSTLCEFDKSRRLAFCEGTVRARYDGRGLPPVKEEPAQATLF